MNFSNELIVELGTAIAYFLVLAFFIRPPGVKGLLADLLLFLIMCSPLILGIMVQVNLRDFGFGLVERDILVSVALGIPFGISYFLIQYYWLNLKILMSTETIKFLARRTRSNAIRRVVEGELLSPVGEGILYRGFILIYLVRSIGIVGVILAPIPFIIQLRTEPAWAAHVKTLRNKIFTVYVVITLGLIAYLSGSLVGSMISHAISNLPFSFITLKQSQSHDQDRHGH